MTLDPSAVTEALPHIDALATRADMQKLVGNLGLERLHVTVAAARSWVEGEELKWCEAHHSYFLEREPDEYAMCLSMLHENAWDTLPEPELCRIVSKRLCDGIDGGDR